MSSRQKIGLAFIIGVLAGVVVVLALIVFKANNVAVLNINENVSTTKQTTFSKKKGKKFESNLKYHYYTNSKNKNQYLETQPWEIKSNTQPSNTTTKKIYFKEKIIIDLNTADTLDLQIIKGIGKKRARSISAILRAK